MKEAFTNLGMEHFGLMSQMRDLLQNPTITEHIDAYPFRPEISDLLCPFFKDLGKHLPYPSVVEIMEQEEIVNSHSIRMFPESSIDISI